MVVLACHYGSSWLRGVAQGHPVGWAGAALKLCGVLAGGKA